MSWTEIEVLVDRAKLGDRDAFGELVVRFERTVYGMALKHVRNPGEAEELAHEVFVHAMRKIPQLREARAFAGWLRRMTARMAINRMTRRGAAFSTEPEMLDAIAGEGRRPDEDMEASEAKAGLHAGLKLLKAEDRATLEAFYLRGDSLKKMSADFDAPVGTIKRRLHVARHRLKEVLEAKGHPGCVPAELADAPQGKKQKKTSVDFLAA